MNVADVLKYGNLTLLDTLKNVPKSTWETPGVCGVWSVKDIVAHLSSYELMLAETQSAFLDGGPTPIRDTFSRLGGKANDHLVEARQALSIDEILGEYEAAHAKVMSQIVQIPEETRRQNGTIPWYGEDYDLEDLITYMNYAHKREHCAEINVFRDQLEQTKS